MKAIYTILLTTLLLSPLAQAQKGFLGQLLANTTNSCRIAMAKPLSLAMNPAKTFRDAKNTWLWNYRFEEGPMKPLSGNPSLAETHFQIKETLAYAEALVQKSQKEKEDKLLVNFAQESYKQLDTQNTGLPQSSRSETNQKLIDLELEQQLLQRNLKMAEQAISKISSFTEAQIIYNQILYFALEGTTHRELIEALVENPLDVGLLLNTPVKSLYRFADKILLKNDLIELGVTSKFSYEAMISAMYSSYINYKSPGMRSVYSQIKTPIQLKAFQIMLRHGFMGSGYFNKISSFRNETQLDWLIIFGEQQKVALDTKKNPFTESSDLDLIRENRFVPPIGFRVFEQMNKINGVELLLKDQQATRRFYVREKERRKEFSLILKHD